MCAKEKEDKKLLKNEINVEYTQNSVRRLLVREYVYFRKLKGLTQAEVAERAGISRTNISRFESGKYNPTLDMLVKLAREGSASKGNTIRGKFVASCYCISGLSI